MGVKQLFQLEGRVAVITGGSRGLGLQMAAALGEMGCKVAISARKVDELELAKDSLEAAGVEVQTVVSDLQQTDHISTLVEEVISGLGPIDILVNNAGATWGGAGGRISRRGLAQSHEPQRYRALLSRT